MEDASGVVFLGMRGAKGGGACRGSRGRLRGGGALKENKLFFPVKGSKGGRVQRIYTLGEFLDIRASPGHLCKRSRQATKVTRAGAWWWGGV